MSPQALAVSPHLDDAAFSVGGTLCGLVRNGWEVTVATCFTASFEDPRGFALECQLDKGLPAEVDYMALRRAEDAEWARRLGVGALHLPLLEAPHRGYGSAAELFGPVRADDNAHHTVGASLARLLDELEPDLVIGPQGLGHHVDHVQVVRALSPLRDEVWWWADLPYALRAPEREEPERVERLGPDLLEAKLHAAAAYQSQLGFQFGGKAGMRRVLGLVPEEGFRSRPAVSAIPGPGGPER